MKKSPLHRGIVSKSQKIPEFKPIFVIRHRHANPVMHPLHPGTTSYFRQAMYPSGSKSNLLDADAQLDLLVKHRDRPQVWKPDTEGRRCRSTTSPT